MPAYQEFAESLPVAEQAAIFRGALERVRSMPGVASATVVKSMPFTGFTVPPIGVPGLTSVSSRS